MKVVCSDSGQQAVKVACGLHALASTAQAGGARHATGLLGCRDEGQHSKVKAAGTETAEKEFLASVYGSWGVFG